MRRLTLAAFALLAAAPLAAQDVNIRSYTIGDYRYYSGTVSTAPVATPLSGSTYGLGSQTYTTLRLGTQQVTGTAYSIGTQDYSSWSNGTTTTGYRIGTQYYTRTNDGRSYTTYSIGSQTYTRGTDGTALTTYTIGNQTYTTGTLGGNRRP